MKKSRFQGFTLVELLVVVAIIGILAMIAITNYWLGLERAKQRKTMSDMRNIAASWEARATDIRGYNAAGWTVPSEVVTTAQIDALLTPTYTKTIPRNDGWGRPLEFTMDEAPGAGAPASVYAIRSAGADGKYEGNSYTQSTTTKFDCDIVYSSGAFVRYPESQ